MSRTLDAIAAQLRAERKRRNLSLTTAAELVGIPAVVIGSYERGDRTPPLDRLRTWAEGLDHKLVAIPAAAGAAAAEIAAGHVRMEYAIAYGAELLPCDSQQQAAELARLIAGAVVVSRTVRLTGWEPSR